MDIHWSTSVYILHIRGPQRVCGLLGTRLHRRWAMGEREKLHLCLQPLPIASTATWAPPPMKSAAALDSQRSVNPTVNCTREGQGCELPMRVFSTPSPLPLSIEKWSSTKLVLGAKKVADHWSRSILSFQGLFFKIIPYPPFISIIIFPTYSFAGFYYMKFPLLRTLF